MSQETGVKIVAYQSDVRDPASIAATINKIAADFGRIDIMVANAGITTHVAAIDQTPESFSEVMKVNLDGAFYTAQAAAKIFQKQGSGNVIFTASVSALLVNIPQKQAAVCSGVFFFFAMYFISACMHGLAEYHWHDMRLKL
jgi:sorbose reductase